MKGYAKILSPDEINAQHERIWYLTVFLKNKSKKPGKMRMAFDAKVQFGDTSANSQLLKCPDQLSLFGVLRRSK